MHIAVLDSKQGPISATGVTANAPRGDETQQPLNPNIELHKLKRIETSFTPTH